jgi:hypothetical protein
VFLRLRPKVTVSRSYLFFCADSMQATTKEMVPQEGDCPDYGEFVDSDGIGDVEDVSEPLERYDQGLYYPVCIGEVLAGRYRIEHKLGWGGYSTVWMAHDEQYRKDVALKIMIPGEKGEYEYQMQNEILRTVRDTSNLVTHQGSFLLPGHGGNHHRVLVLPLLSPSLGYRAKELPVATRVSAAKQLLVALKGLHDVGLVHRGTPSTAILVLDNILFFFSRLDANPVCRP